jgi:endogenous inhibitor of DNA gyrase (YacG/DUF329 family)
MPHPKKQVEIVCASCGKTFSVKKSIADKGRKFCNLKCRDAGKREKVTCKQCNKVFGAHKSQKRQFCSKSCSTTWRNLTDQNPSYHRDITGEKNPMYGKGLKGKDNPMYGKTGAQNPQYKGGRKVRPDGYIMVLAPDDHPARAAAYPYILEHRFIMEQHLGRYLDPKEVVHHIDGDPSNNVIENLELFANQSEHISNGHS